ncbi:MAG: cation transporter [Bdellovibrionaceae bacterium]|nr:cation transporter [Bdellovibrionales bacterium]MCB9085708.1 cation transporter [Pseudobdellovibrionaceae bacterium]
MTSECGHDHQHSHDHGHGSGFGHHHHHHHDLHGRQLVWAVVINVVLTLVQLVGGLMSGSLALVADAVHNFSDAGSLAIAAFARKVAGLPASERMTYGYGRAEILGALVNSTTLVIVGLYLLYESVDRFLHPQPIDGWVVIAVAGVALVVDVITALLTFKGAKDSVNIRAAFVHNVSDALASVVVIISGSIILLMNWYWVDLVATVLISVYILYQSYFLIRECLSVLMQGVPPDIDVNQVRAELEMVGPIVDVHHIHIWQLHEAFRSIEAHLVLNAESLDQLEQIKVAAKKVLREKFRITHSTLEIELGPESNCESCSTGRS